MNNLRNNEAQVDAREKKGWQSYHTVWLLMFVGWFFAYADRTLTGPVVTWMIENKVGFLQGADPHALGGLLGSLFFAGYMLTQFPGGYFGDKFGYRTIIIISIFWAGITTVLTGLTNGLIVFIVLRVLTGLGEGVMYSNDRSLITQVTPPEKRGLGLGLVISGLSLGLTAATIGTIYIINWAEPSWGINAWKAPFLICGTITIAFAILAKYVLGAKKVSTDSYHFGKALMQLGKYSIVFLAAILGVYFLTNSLKLSGVAIAICLAFLAVVLIAFIYTNKADEIGPVLKNRNLFLNYLSSIGICWHLWFYGFWATAFVKDFGGSTLIVAALIASFNGVAGLLGYPLGGKISDMVAQKKNGRRNALGGLFALLALLVFVFAAYEMAGLKNSVVMSIILFISGLVFNALQSIAHNLTTELAPEKSRGAAFGMWNLIGEIGAVLSPVVAGALRDSTGSWSSPMILDGIILGVCVAIIFSITSTVKVKVGKTEIIKS